jgi:ketosteroid isomerase-like protein
MDMKRHSSIFCALGLLASTGCSRPPAPDSSEADARALREGEVAAFVKDWGGKDAGRIADHYTDDGNVMVPNSPMMTGKGAIGTAMKDAMTDPNWSLALQPVQVEVSRGGDLGYTRGTYVLTATDPANQKAVTEKGRFVTILRKEADGSEGHPAHRQRRGPGGSEQIATPPDAVMPEWGSGRMAGQAEVGRGGRGGRSNFRIAVIRTQNTACRESVKIGPIACLCQW